MAIPAALAAHELLHAAVWVRLGGHPSFGYDPALKALVTRCYGMRVPRDAYLRVLRAPYLLLPVGLAALAVWPGTLWPVAVGISVTSSAYDCWSVRRLRKWPATVWVEDVPGGFDVYQGPGAADDG